MSLRLDGNESLLRLVWVERIQRPGGWLSSTPFSNQHLSELKAWSFMFGWATNYWRQYLQTQVGN